MLNYNQDIIAAISTPVGDGAISIVRVSGNGCIELIDTIFKGKIRLSSAKTHTIHHGSIVGANGEVIDEILATVFRSPSSYTTEDMIEINCHGGWFVTNKILKNILDLNVRLAEPGEFTKRAFLNGRIDLTQAEAVADLIKARSELAHKASISQLEGKLYQQVININSQLINLIGLIELELDFVEENIVLMNNELVIEKLLYILKKLHNLIETYKHGKLYREGIKLVITGLPNSGKSSLLNILLQEERAIVTPYPGTTRDIIEENFTINGALFRLIDTAGIHTSDNFIEIEGIRRSKKKIQESDLLLLLVDLTKDNFQEEINLIKNIIRNNKPLLIVQNKCDLVDIDKINSNSIINHFPDITKCTISALNGTGIESLKSLIFSTALSDSFFDTECGITITNERHRQCLIESSKYIELAIESAKKKLTGEFISLDIRAAIDSLGSIIGKVTTNDILNDIFSKFCIGK